VIRRLPQISFGFLALATIGAFFLVQVLKTAPPLLWGPPTPVPSAIDPLHGRVCISRPNRAHPAGVPINYREATLALAVSHTDTVGVYIVSQADAGGAPVATISAGTPMVGAPGPGNVPLTDKDSRVFRWNGRLTDGQPAPDAIYYFRIVLEKEGRSDNLSQTPVQVLSEPPNAKILSVRLLGTRAAADAGSASVTGTASTGATSATATGAGGKGARDLVVLPGPAVLTSATSRVRITFTRGAYRRVSIKIYRTDVAGTPERVDTLRVTRLHRNWINWNGKIGREPAPAGTYLIGITAENLACDQAQWPTIPPAPGTTADAGVTVRYLSVTPPLAPTISGGRASVTVDSPSAAFSWRLRRSGNPKTVERGSGPAGRSVIHVPIPRHETGLYMLTVNAGTQSSAVPLVGSEAGPAAAHARVLVVLPMLTWMGDSPVDDSGDGLPDTLRAGSGASLERPLVDGPPAGFGADVTLLHYLTAHHLSYQLTTDVALSEGEGPSLADRGGVVFPEGANFLPAGLELTLRGFARGGGRVLVLGTGALGGASHISGFPAAPRASAPHTTSTDLFGARRGPVTPTAGELISSVSGDAFNLFGNAGEFAGFSHYQPIRPPRSAPSGTVSAVGIGSAAPAIVAFHDGSGTVVEVGLSGFAASLAHNADSDNLLANVWQLLSR
jgi:hypothetical protein